MRRPLHLATAALALGLATAGTSAAHAAQPAPEPVGDSPGAAKIADLDGDKRWDLITADGGDDTVTILMGREEGGYDRRTESTGDRPSAVDANDFDGDGRLDLAVANAASNDITVMLQQADGSYAKETLQSGQFPVDLVVADFNADGNYDIATAHLAGDSITTFAGDGRGGFAREPDVTTDMPHGLAAADFNADGYIDLAATNHRDGTVTKFIRDAVGLHAQQPIAVGDGPVGIATGRFDADDEPDLVVANEDDNTFTIVSSQNGTRTDPAGARPYGVAAGKLDDDDQTDFAITNAGADTVSVFSTERGWKDFATGRGPRRLDLDDGFLAVPDADDDTVRRIYPDRQDETPPPPAEPTPTPTPTPPQVVRTAPVNTARPTIAKRHAVLGGGWKCSPGEWSDAEGFTYEWLRFWPKDGIHVEGSYEVVGSGDVYHWKEADGTRQIACRVTARNAVGSTQERSLSQRLDPNAPSTRPVYGNVRISGIDLFQTTQPNSGATMFAASGGFPSIPGGGTPNAWLTGGDPQQAEYIGVEVDGDKAATAVVYVNTTDAGTSSNPLNVTLVGRLGDRVLGKVALTTPGVRVPRTTSPWVEIGDRDNPDYGVQLAIPQSWLRDSAVLGIFTGERLSLSAAVEIADGYTLNGINECAAGRSCGGDNGYRLSGIRPRLVRGIDLRTLEVTTDGAQPGSLRKPDDVLHRARDLFPGGESIGVTSSFDGVRDLGNLSAIKQGDIACLGESDLRECKADKVSAALLQWMAENPSMANTDALMAVHRYLIDPANPKGWEPGWASGQIWNKRSDNMFPPVLAVDDGSAGRPITASAHEYGHILGLDHAGADPTCYTSDPAQVGEAWGPDNQGRTQSVKFDRTATRADGKSDPRVDTDAMPMHDLMSYCPAGSGSDDRLHWISARNWNKTFEKLSSYRKMAASSGAAAAGSPAFAVGAVGPKGARIDAVTQPDGHDVIPAPAASDVHLRSLDEAGRVLLDAPAAVQTSEHGDPGTGAFIGAVHAAAARVEVTVGGRATHTVHRSGAPSVRVAPLPRSARPDGALTVRWKSEDGDSKALLATIDYSADGGRTFRTVYAGPDRGRATLPGALLSRSSRARLRVTVSDGFAESSALTRPFRAAGAAPRVAIVHPAAAGERLTAGNRVLLTAAARNDRGERLETVTWYAGGRRIGRGTSLSVVLPKGRAVLRAVARDGAGRTATARRTVVIH